MAQAKNDWQKAWAKVVATAWADERFKEKLLKNPEQALKEVGIQVPQGMKLAVHEQTSKMGHFILPEKPKAELSEVELRAVAAGACSAPFLNILDKGM